MATLLEALHARHREQAFTIERAVAVAGESERTVRVRLRALTSLGVLEEQPGRWRFSFPWRRRSAADVARVVQSRAALFETVGGSDLEALRQEYENRAQLLSALLEFEPDTASLVELARRMTARIEDRLAGRPSSLKVLESHAGHPTGAEAGKALVVDWGGTNGRAVLLGLDRGDCEELEQSVHLFGEADRTGPVATVLDNLAACVAEVAPAGESLPLALVYSFPARLEARDRAIALPLTKGWNPIGLEGADVVQLFREALRERGLGRVQVEVVANDTVAPMLLSTWRRRAADPAAAATDLGLILGTGTNLAVDLGDTGIRNLESGNFDDVGSVANRFDDALDTETDEPPPGAQRFEKLISGAYLGQLAARVVSKLAATRSPWVQVLRAAWMESRGQPTRHLSRWITEQPGTPLAWLAVAIGRRAARLAAAAVVGAARAADPSLQRSHTVAVDGSLYSRFPGFPEWFAEGLQEVAGDRSDHVEVDFVENSTQTGAAVLALWARERGMRSD